MKLCRATINTMGEIRFISDTEETYDPPGFSGLQRGALAISPTACSTRVDPPPTAVPILRER